MTLDDQGKKLLKKVFPFSKILDKDYSYVEGMYIKKEKDGKEFAYVLMLAYIDAEKIIEGDGVKNGEFVSVILDENKVARVVSIEDSDFKELLDLPPEEQKKRFMDMI